MAILKDEGNGLLRFQLSWGKQIRTVENPWSERTHSKRELVIRYPAGCM